MGATGRRCCLAAKPSNCQLPSSYRAVSGGTSLLLPQSPGSGRLEGSNQLPWPGRRFQHILNVKESCGMEKDESVNPIQSFMRGLVETRIMIRKM